MISAKKHFMNQWQVVNCRVNVGNVIGYFAKSQTASWKAIGRFEEKSEGGNFTTQSPGLLPQQDIIQIFSAVPRLMTGIRNNLGRPQQNLPVHSDCPSLRRHHTKIIQEAYVSTEKRVRMLRRRNRRC